MANVEDLDPRPFLELLGEIGLPSRVIDMDGTDRPI
jgi:saccharopine dehydrogenase-like NADP-dependent oxidoreductase